jgi:hypothetical protein
MANITTYDELFDYCKLMLGSPVVRVNVTPEQAMAKFKDVLDLYRQYHYNATEKVYLSHQLSDSEIANKEIVLPSNITGVEEVYTSSIAGTRSWSYQATVTSLFEIMQNNAAGAGITGFLNFERNIAEINSILGNKVRWNFVLHRNALKIVTDWSLYQPGDYIIIEGWMSLDPEVHTSIFNDPWVKEMAMWQIRYMWGTNLTKFSNVTLPGGISVNGEQIRDEAKAEIERMREEIMDKWMTPPMITLG